MSKQDVESSVRTHEAIDHALCGVPVKVGSGAATVELATTAVMAVDARGLVHGGFLFGAADHAAMLAVNHPLVVLGSSSSRFRAPVTVGERVVFEAQCGEDEGRRRTVEVTGRVGEREVFTGTFTTFVLDAHVLDR